MNYSRKCNSRLQFVDNIIRTYNVKRKTKHCTESDFILNNNKSTKNETTDEIEDNKQQYTTKSLIDYSGYIQKPAIFIDNSLDASFQGILHFIFFHSNCKFNTSEIIFHFPNPMTSKVTFSDLLQIFNYKNAFLGFQTASIPSSYLAVSFKRIKVKPLCYSIRSDSQFNNSPHLKGYVFEAFDEEHNKWDTLDERVNSNDLIPSESYQLYYVRMTNKYYKMFRIRQTEEAHNNRHGFSIAGFDIQGKIQLLDEEKYVKQQHDARSIEYNPFMEGFGFDDVF